MTASGAALPLSPSGEPLLQLSAINGEESLSEIYTYTLDFLTPPDAMLLEQQTAHNDFERYEWPGDYTEARPATGQPVRSAQARARGEQVARVRMEEVRARGERAQGSGYVRAVVCGTTFRLAGYAQQQANQEYLVLGAQFTATEVGEASGSGRFRIETDFVVQPATTVYRPPRTVAKPRTNGPQTAMVTGPKGQEIWTDQYGRVKLKFHWDRSPERDQNSSCWVRVSYPWAGSNFGGVNIPRVGSEVIVDFENGDPNRPIVTGRVFNAMTMPPWKLPDNATQSGMLSRSMKGHHGKASAIRFDDRQGAEELWLQAERNMRTEVENDRDTTIGANDTTRITGNRDETISGSHGENIKGTMMLTVQGASEGDAAVPAGQDAPPAMNITVIRGDISMEAKDGSIHLSASKTITLTVGKSSITMDSDGHITVLGPEMILLNK